MNVNELEQLAKAATPGPWIGAGPSFGDAMPKFINEVLVDRPDEEDDSYEICRSPFCFEDGASNDLRYIAAANPSAISELISAYRESVAALKETTFALEHRWEVIANRAAPVMEGVIDAAHTTGIQALNTAKRLGVE